MPVIEIDVHGCTASVRGNPIIVCGNSDITFQFHFDDEWNGFENKLLRICYIFRRSQKKVTNTSGIPPETGAVGGICVWDTDEIVFSVLARHIRTTALVRIPCLRCITDLYGEQVQEQTDCYNTIMTEINEVISNA